MKRIFLMLPVLIFLFSGTLFPHKVSCANHHALPDSLVGLITQEEYDLGWRPLFNGKDLQGWKGFLTPGVPPGWYVEDNMLVTRGDSLVHPVDLITIQQFEDFELSLEWAICWQGNSGIFYHSMENSWAAWVMGPEYALVDESNLDEMDGIYKTGSCYGMYAPMVNCVAPQSAFNLSRIKVKQGHVEHWLNGQKVVEYQLWSDEWYERVEKSKWNEYAEYGRTMRGSIGLQGHGFEVKFKNIKIRDITEQGQSLVSLVDDDGWQTFGDGQWNITEKEIIGQGRNTGFAGVLPNLDPGKGIVLRTQFFPEVLDTIRISLLTQEGKDLLFKDYSWNIKEFIADSTELGYTLVNGKSPFNQKEWNDLVIRYKDHRLLVWLNDRMILQEKVEMIPRDLQYISFSYPETQESRLHLRNVYMYHLD